jgi:hypothetical protein
MPSRQRAMVLLFTAATLGGWWAFRPEKLFTSSRVDDALPPAAAPVGSAAPSMDTTERASDMPVATVVARGSFHSNAHETSGVASVHRLADGTHLLRLENLATSDGPDVRVYLVAAPDVNDDVTVKRAGFVELGKLKATHGNQNYTIPASVDLSSHRSVTIWCKRFSVNFGTAPLRISGA